MVNIPKYSGRSSEELSFKAVLVNGKCTDKSSTNGISLVNGKHKAQAQEKKVVNGHTRNKRSGNEKVNECSDKMPVDEASALNGESNEVLVTDVPFTSTVKANSTNGGPVNEVSIVNGKTYGCSDKMPVDKASTLNGESNKVLVTDVPVASTVDANSTNGGPVNEVSIVNGMTNGSIYSNGSNIPSENGNDSFIVVKSKKSKKNESKKHQYHAKKRPISNLPPVNNSANIRHNNRTDKNCGEKTSPTHLSQKQPCTFASVKSTEKSYSSVLANGNGISQLRNGGHKISDIQTVTKCTESKKHVNKTNLKGNCVSVEQLSADITKCVVVNDAPVVSCEQNSSLKVEMTNVSAQTVVSSPNEISSSLKECLPSHDVVINESETQSPSDYVDVGDMSDLSSNPAYCDSVASNDSGRGGSEIVYDESSPYCCEFPSSRTALLIGRKGSFKNEIERKSGVRLWVYSDTVDEELDIVSMIGTAAQVETAKRLIKQRFRGVNLTQWVGSNPVNPPLPASYLATLPIGTNFYGMVSVICDPNFFWLQQHDHPHVYSLQGLQRRMTKYFKHATDVPCIENPTIGSIICLPDNGPDGTRETVWLRGCILEIMPEIESVNVRYLDYGGDRDVPISKLRPMRPDFVSMPFFAAQCSLHDIIPTGGVWSQAAIEEFKRLTLGCLPIVKAVFKHEECYYVNMFCLDTVTNTTLNISEYLISKGWGIRPSLLETEIPTELQQ